MRTLAFGLLALLVLSVSAVAADRPDIPDRLQQAKAGEWVIMQNVTGAGQHDKIKISVTKVGGGSVTVKREQLDNDGNVVDTKEHDIALSQIQNRVNDLKQKASSIVEETVYIKDKPVKTVAIAWAGDSKEDQAAGRQFKVWVTNDLPVGGMAKSWSSDSKFPSYEVVDFGF